MLTLAFPGALGLLAALGAVAFFYFLRMKFRRQTVSSTFLWESLVKINEGAARLKYRSLLLLLLQFLTVGALVLALAGLEWVQSFPARPGTVYLLDASGSMGATEASGRPRFDRAVEALKGDAAVLPPGTPFAVFLVDDGTTFLGTFTAGSGPGLAPALGGARPGAGTFSEEAAAGALAAWVQTRPGPWSGVLVSDGGLDLGGSRLADVFDGRLRSLDFALSAPNLGLTDVRLGDVPQPGVRYTVFNGFLTRQNVHLVLFREGQPVDRWTESVPPGPTSLGRAVPGVGTPGLWRLAFEGNTDALTGDDGYDVEVSPPRPARILSVGQPVPFLRAAFPGADFHERGAASMDGGPWDLVIASGDDLPRGWKGNLVTFGPLPSGAPVFWGPPVSGMLSSSSVHPLARWVPWGDVRADGAASLVVSPGATVLASVDDWPVAAAWDADGYRYLALGADTARSNLGFTAALPILMKNLRQEIVPQEANPLTDNLRVGESVDRAGGPDWHVVSGPGGASSVEAVRRGGLWTLTAHAPGTFGWADGKQTGAFTSHLPASESDTAPRTVPGVSGAPPPAGREQRFETSALAPWLALVALALLVLEWRLWNGRFATRTKPALAYLRWGATAAAILALGGVSLPLPAADRALVLLFDVSQSLGPALVEGERTSALALLDTLDSHDRVALVAFASAPRVLSGLLPSDQARQALEAAGLDAGSEGGFTDVQAALTAGAQLLEGQPGAKGQYLFSDGRANKGGDIAALSGRARVYPVSAVPFGRALSGVVGQGLDLPPSARPGEKVAVRWTGWTDQDQTATAVLSVDGKPSQNENITLKAGTNTVEFSLDAGTTGTHTVEVAVAGSKAAGLLPVEGRNAILVIQGPGTGSALGRALEAQGFPVVFRGPDGLPDSAAGFQRFSALILDNVPGPALTGTALGALQDWVAGGGGLLVVGGDSSLGRGEYFDSPLEDMLPVRTDTRRRLQFTRSRILFVVDHSGSMTDEVAGVTKLQAAVQGISRSLGELTPQDEVGILEFDTEATWILPFTPLTQKKTVLSSLDTFDQGGGTDMTKALDEVLAAFGHPGPVKRHVILLTDGQTSGEPGFFQDFTEKLKAAQVSLTVLGIGQDVNDSLLSSLASGGEGLYYHVEGDQVPSVIHKETVRVTRDLIQEGRFFPRAVGEDPVVDLGTSPPSVRGYLVTQPKPAARLLWEFERPDGGRDPMAATGRYGAGRVGVVTTDSGARWLAGWSGLPVYNRFWGQLVRNLETGPRDRGLRVDLTTAASVTKVVVEALDAGRLRTGASLVAVRGGTSFPLKETAPGRYETTIPVDPGIQVISVYDRTSPAHTWAWTWNPPGSELNRGGADWAGLGRLASTTGGRLQPAASPAPPPTAWTWAQTDLRGWWLLLALGLFLGELTLRSTSLGQLAQARARFEAWWADQARPWTRQIKPPVVRTAGDDERRTREAYRALATRRQPKDEA